MTHLDLFSGIGGMALAAQWAGWRTVAFSEVEAYPSSLLARRWPGVRNLGDVRALCADVHSTRTLNDELGPIHLLTAGVPCQPASNAGERRGTADERWLWPDALRVLGGVRPRFALFENPAALVGLESGRAFSGILGGLADLGYDAWGDCIPAGALGAGHRRNRVWLVAADSLRTGLEGHAGHGEDCGRAQSQRHAGTPDLHSRIITSPQWYHQSGIAPVVDGLPRRLVIDQLTAIGNALVPQVPYLILRHLYRLCGFTGHLK